MVSNSPLFVCSDLQVGKNTDNIERVKYTIGKKMHKYPAVTSYNTEKKKNPPTSLPWL